MIEGGKGGGEGPIGRHSPHDPISTFANDILDVILIRDVERDLARSSWLLLLRLLTLRLS